ncbi:LLM class flavin-dependent oxidoreductase [Streptomyces sp. NEAU-W12]|uniref:LLM class flavin-dependent oxidoreductase n=1 Tax=Streptomyces sp. NEAU-W12 TaxID=2994668 RepID=UPI00224AB2AA|nr:LLM class flavin-dependent oxidoreductase [Streptomyces sp. NEAU-W12]MCX2928449.1 LLM class flavin-dependent oxidoreductase [Streptomyces sp. NEAU-W12]
MTDRTDSVYSVLMPFAPPRPEQILPFAALTQWSGAHRLWQGQAMLNQPHQAFAYAAASGFRVPVGLGVTLMPFTHPYEAALQAQSLAAATGHPVVAGFGPGAAVLQRSMCGAPYRSPLAASREYLTAVRGLLDGELVEQDGTYFTCHGKLLPVPRPPIEVGLGVLRPGMARLAGEVADTAITWLTPAAYLRDTIVPALREGAKAAGRPVPRLVSIVPVALAEADRAPAALALASNIGHLRLPHYVDMLRRSGIRTDSSDPAAGAAALVEGRAFLYGEPKVLAEEFAAYREAGVDEIVLNVTGVNGMYGSRTALRELETVLAEVTS